MPAAPLMYVNWTEWTMFRLSPAELEQCERDLGVFAASRVSGLLDMVEIRSGPDDFAELWIEYRPFASQPCADCVAEGIAEPALATERERTGNTWLPLCACHAHLRSTIRVKSAALDDDEWLPTWLAQMGALRQYE